MEDFLKGFKNNLLSGDLRKVNSQKTRSVILLVTCLELCSFYIQRALYCDLKPSNILLDENGHAKLCDFGIARKLSDISKTPFAQLPQAKRGTPCYMAPELFEDGGVHS